MPWVAAAIVGSAIIGGAMSNRAAKKAASGQTDAANAATQAQLEQYYQTREDQMPWLETGKEGVGRLSDLLGIKRPASTAQQIENDQRYKDILNAKIQQFDREHQARFGVGIWDGRTDAATRDKIIEGYKTDARQEFIGQYGDIDARAAREREQSPEFGSLLRDFTNADFVKDPGYEFRLAEGNKAIENAARARGVYMSPMTVKELLRYGQDYASNEFGNAYNRDMSNRTTKFNMLSGISGTGQTAANTVGNTGANMIGNVGQLMTGAANARGAAGIAGANAWNNGISNIGNFYQQQQNRNQQQQWMDRLFPQIYNSTGANSGNVNSLPW